jgi:hypothetical protein
VVSRDTADKFDELLQGQAQMFDLVYRVNTRRWVWVFDTDVHGVQDRIDSIAGVVESKIPGARMSWSKPQMIPLEARRTHSRLSDLMIRETLSASTSGYVRDNDEVRLGTAPIKPSKIAATRLDEEMRWLARQLRSQSQQLRQQAKNLRPSE